MTAMGSAARAAAKVAVRAELGAVPLAVLVAATEAAAAPVACRQAPLADSWAAERAKAVVVRARVVVATARAAAWRVVASATAGVAVDTVATLVVAVVPVVPMVAAPNRRHTHSTLGWK